MRDFPDVKILVLGDIIVDRYIIGTSDRISPEAPVPVVRFEEEKLVCGGAANVAKNVEGLRATVYLCGFVGNDATGIFIRESFDNTQGISCWDKPTITKTRIIANGQQIARIDEEDTSWAFSPLMKEYLYAVLPEIDLVIISDYAKGTITKEIVDVIKSMDKQIIVDPKPQNIDCYKFVETIMPNRKEAEEIVGRKLGANEHSFLKDLKSYTECKNAVVTLGNEGLISYNNDKDGYIGLPSTNQKVFDVTGAGDTLIAVYGTAIATGIQHYYALELATRAAGIAVGKPGTYAIQLEDLQ